MGKIFNYCYYRISKFYKDWWESDPEIVGGIVFFSFLGFFFLSILGLFLFLFEIEMTEMLIAVVLLSFVVVSFFFAGKKKYRELEEYYKEERHGKLKGWLVCLFGISSFVLYFITMYFISN
jgi:Ca2+/Na+ antiporter